MKTTLHLLASAALLAAFTATHAAQNSGGNPPAAPTHTVPAQPPKNLVIKTKSVPPRSEPASTKPIEERKVPPQPGCGPTRPGDQTTSTC
jgi:hypothetical protein